MIASLTFKKSPNKSSSSNTTNTDTKNATSNKLPKFTFRSKRSVANNQANKLILSIGGRPLHLQEVTAKGSTSTIWKVLDTTSKHDSYYALKAIALQSKDNDQEDFFEVEQRARLEIDALKQIRQENVITLLDHEWGCDDPFKQSEDEGCGERRYHRYCYLLTPLYPMNLMQFVQNSQNCKITDRILLQNIIQGICKGLEAVHQAGYRHNDIRPDNILIQPIADNRAHVVLADFGSVSPANIEVPSRFEADRQKQFHMIYSHPNYTAPELWLVLPRSWITPKTDAFSVGCTLYFLLLGKPPFEETMGLGRRLTFPKSHELDFFFYHLCLAFLLKSPQKRLSISDALSSIFHLELSSKTHSLIHEEFHMFHGVKNVTSHPSDKYNLAKELQWKCNPGSSCVKKDIVKECQFMTYLGEDDSDDETVMTDDESVMNQKSLIRTIGCSLSY